MKRRKKPPDLISVPRIFSADPFICADCDRLHLVLNDENGNPVAHFANTDQQWSDLFDIIVQAMKSRHIQ